MYFYSRTIQALAKLTNDKFTQPKRVVEQEIQTVQEQLTTLQQELQDMQQEVQVRDSQFQLLMQYLLDLKRSIQQDQENNNHHHHHHEDEGKGTRQEQQSFTTHGKDNHKNNITTNIVIPMDVDDNDEGLYGDL
jgi:hypothetical protein